MSRFIIPLALVGLAVTGLAQDASQPHREGDERPAAFLPDDVRVSPPGRPLIDPEFNDGQHRVTYWDRAGGELAIGVAELDPRTGLLKSQTGRDFLVDTGVSPAFKEGRWWSHNGPEWGRDRNGWAIYYTKEDEEGNRQMWRAVERGGRYVPEQLTTKPGGHCGALVSQCATAPDTRMLFYINFDLPRLHTVAWALASDPNEFHPLPDWRGSHSIARVVGEHHIGYAPRDSAGVPQVVLFDTRSGTGQVVTAEPGDKFDTYGFRAPEFGGELLMMANIDRERLAIFRDVNRNGSPWQKIAELRLPADSPFRYLYSCEPIAPETEVNGVSYFSLNATREPTGRRGETGRAERDGSIWVFGLGNDPDNRLVRRIDEGAVSGIETVRYEAEAMVGSDEVFVYYERRDPDTSRGELRRCRTGIRTAGEDTQSNVPPDGDPAPISIENELTKPSLEVCLNAGDEAEARRFFVDGLGLTERAPPPGGGGGNTRKMLRFAVGSSHIKVRLYDTPPPATEADIAARNGFRLLTIPVEDLDATVARLERSGFACGDPAENAGTRWALARNADGTPFDLVEIAAGGERNIEIGFVVPDASEARAFFRSRYGARELPAAVGRVLEGERELRFAAGSTILKCWAPEGARESDTDGIGGAMGFRYVTHNVEDAARFHEYFTARGTEIETPMTSYRGIAPLFIARGPGGALLEFISFGGATPETKGGGTAPPLFQRLDRNGDGRLSAREIPSPERFRTLDGNGDGPISLQEFATGLRASRNNIETKP